MSNPAIPKLPLYQSHKRVWAVKIKGLLCTQDGVFIVPDDPDLGNIPVGPEYLDKHNPEPGGYFVLYEDNYQSFSPAEAFESGYTLVQG